MSVIAERNIVGIVDSGGRGAALARAYERSPHVDGIVVIPGNDLTAEMATKPTFVFPNISNSSADAIADKFSELGVTLADVAQDNAIEAGVTDRLREQGIATIGPSRDAGQIEWSKAYARGLGKNAGLQQPRFETFTRIEPADWYIDHSGEENFVVKANGLAEGKGVKLAHSSEEAKRMVRLLHEQHAKASEIFLIEEMVAGEEFSTFFASDGEHIKLLGHAQDHKREGNYDTGENTGGMGASTPPRLMTRTVELVVEQEVKKMMTALSEEGRPYEGIGYYGGMLNEVLKRVNNIEWNARWGDPEVEIVAPGITSDIFELAVAIVKKSLDKYTLTTDNLARVVVAGASRGYPRDYSMVKGKEVFGLDYVMHMEGVELYGAGVKVDEDGRHWANGGRLFYIVGQGENVIEAREKAYGAMARVHVDGNNLMYRNDIGWKDVQRLRDEGY